MRMQSKRTTEGSTDRGVSPVIGVILMVAITVILAAVIAAFVLDIGPGETDPSATYELGDVDENNVEVELNSLGSNTDGIIVAEDVGDEEFPDEGGALSVSGDSETYQSNDGFDEDSALIAFTSDEEDPTGFDDIDNFAIIDNLDDLDD